jgi:hypothetical protein
MSVVVATSSTSFLVATEAVFRFFRPLYEACEISQRLGEADVPAHLRADTSLLCADYSANYSTISGA